MFAPRSHFDWHRAASALESQRAEQCSAKLQPSRSFEIVFRLDREPETLPKHGPPHSSCESDFA